jgi:uncharacterized protein
MGRVVILVVLVLIIAWWLFGRINKARSGAAAQAAQGKRKSETGAQHMVACAHCDVHLPLADALKEGSLHYCGEPHRLLGPRV